MSEIEAHIVERKAEVNNCNPFWHCIRSFFSRADPTRKFIIVYPPLDTTPETFKPWEYDREPDEYDKFWKARMMADKINRKKGIVIAIVVECPMEWK